ncbi:VOC family protein [bacterium]|nr:VOC family protein [bacterium]MBU1637065.1 VOC family protein [bacterium]
MHGFCHIELSTLDLEKAQRFYAELFGWQMMPFPGMEYMVIRAGEGAVGGGIMKVDKIVQQDRVYSYVEVEDIEAILKKAESLGGKTIQAKQVLPDASWGATGVLETPCGYRLGLWAKA